MASHQLFMGEQDHQELPPYVCEHKLMFEEMSRKRKIYMDLDDRIPRKLAVPCHFCKTDIVLGKDARGFVGDGDVDRIICYKCEAAIDAEK